MVVGGGGGGGNNGATHGGNGGIGGGGGAGAGAGTGTTGQDGISGDNGGAGGNGTGSNKGAGGGGFGGPGITGSGSTGLGGQGGPGISSYNGGDANSGSRGGGGGSSGGGLGGNGGAIGIGGAGGIGIQNTGTITNLYNLQGVSSTTISINGSSVYTIPLYITGTLPTNYYITIDDTVSRFGQLYGKTVSGTSTFAIDTSSTITGLTVGNTKTYTNVKNGITFSNSSGIISFGDNNYSWLFSGNNLLVTLDSISCYNKDTTVLTKINDIEQYVNIYDLIPGNLIKTYLHGYKPLKVLFGTTITTSEDDGKNEDDKNENELNSMYIIKKHDTMTHDLIITGGHYILVDDISKNKSKCKFYQPTFIDDKYCILCMDWDGAKKIKEKNTYEIYHLVLDGEQPQYGIYVNGGFLSESTSEVNFIRKNKTCSIIKKNIKYFIFNISIQPVS